MKRAGIFFGAGTGTTRRSAEIDDLQNYARPVPGTPAYGDGGLTGKSTGVRAGAWLNEPG